MGILRHGSMRMTPSYPPIAVTKDLMNVMLKDLQMKITLFLTGLELIEKKNSLCFYIHQTILHKFFLILRQIFFRIL